MTALDAELGAAVRGSDRAVTRAEVEDFLFAEAALLDRQRYDEWLALFVEGGRYEVPTTDAGATPASQGGYFVCDDWDLLRARVKRLRSRKAHAENPPSLVHRMIANVRLLEREGDELAVTANFIVHRARDGRTNAFPGRYVHRLQVTDDGLRFRLRRAELALEQLEAGARLSFIL
ncbi:aromatic-ring-hydroxylating dioxygenase subunit beta [Trujillonella endophytica]|uniref:p-cumate 2,3-dioxygenase beta subunit n=1 Tax=Trujillonella endophytica TaxID=673521 RepID=A0A1H8UGJ8_9ACTN|nr:aromatic-ring-hydroxylating dioxygenase subunit beta [Trujillella endophytica]SEP01728.1 p-cumate 2,3-dioxygenase beta subunit [Trujillella endophytica]